METIFIAVNNQDDETFEIHAENERHAKLVLIEKLGYDIIHNDNQTVFFLVDLDVPQNEHIKLNSECFETALNEVLSHSNWSLQTSYDLLNDMEVNEGC